LAITTFTLSRAVIAEEGIPAIISACINPEDEKVTAITILDGFNWINVQDLVAELGVPELVLWGNGTESRVVVWLTKGVAASVSVDGSERFNPYGAITLITYFPYQSLEGYEERWPYTHRASSKADLVTLTPFLPYTMNPFDFEAMLATDTPPPTLTPTFTPSFVATIYPQETDAYFVVENNEIRYSNAPAFTPCNYALVGEVFDLNGEPYTDYVVNIQMLHFEEAMATETPGRIYKDPDDSHWDVLLPWVQVDYVIWLTAEDGDEELSPRIYVDMRDCDQNKAEVNFVQVRPLP
jgi:hypothetical protein